MKTYMAKKEQVERKWYIINAEGETLGRLATRVSDILRGKNKPTFTPHVDTGDHVIVINASKVGLTGKKLKEKVYYRHSGYPGGLKSATAEERLKKRPAGLIIDAVKGMLPKNTLSRSIIMKLKVYGDGAHPHAAQQPEVLSRN